MGDIWPYGPPRTTDWQQCYDAMRSLGLSESDANIMAALGGSEAGYDLAVVNDTPATGDYSVGVWQINYYNGLYNGRVQEFGTPRHLARSTVSTQASAAHQIWVAQGFGAWGSYTHGQYRQYLHGNLPSGPSPSHQLQFDNAPTTPGKDTWSRQIKDAADRIGNTSSTFGTYADTIKDLR